MELKSILKSTNDIDNESFTSETTNDNDNGVKFERNKHDRIAEQLVGRFNNPLYRAFYCKVSQSLSEARIHQLAEYAEKHGKNPSAYFSFLVKKEMG